MSSTASQTLDKIAPLLAFGRAAVYVAVVTGFEDLAWAIRGDMSSATNREHSILATGLKPSSAGHLDELAGISTLPNPKQRWTVRRKAAVVEAVRGGCVPIEKVCTVYDLSIDEFLAWERDLDRNGTPGLRSTRYQIYRNTDIRKGLQARQPNALHLSI
jgi:hypothetical protein